MNELTLKLKDSFIQELTSNEQLMDQPYLVSGTKSYSRRELAEEIRMETEFGIKKLAMLLSLSLDLLARQKETI